MSRAERRRKARHEAKRRESHKKGWLSSRVARILALVLVGAVVLGVASWGVLSYTSDRQARRTVLRVVNGQEITRYDLDQRIGVVRYIYGLEAKDVDPTLEDSLLEGLVEDYLIAADAAQRGLDVTDEDLAAVREQVSASIGSLYATSLQATAQRIRLGVGEADVEAYERSLVLGSKLYEDVTAGLEVTEEDILALYEEYKETLDQAGLSLDEARDTLAQDALDKKREEAYTAYLDELKAQADISTPG